MKYICIFIGSSCLSLGSTYAMDLSNLSIGFQGGYTSLGQFEAIKLSNSFPLLIHLDYQFTNRIHSQLAYQWIKTEHSGSWVANFQSIQIIPGYQFAQINNHAFHIESGFGYQYVNLNDVDTIRHTEWTAGPSWSWNFLETWKLITNVRYTQSLNVSFQHIDIGVGLSYQFGTTTHYAQKKPINTNTVRDRDHDNVPDSKDICPNTPHDSEVDEAGCPLSTIGRGVIDGVVFEAQGPRLTSASKLALLPIAENLKKYPNLIFVIEGYTSSASTNISKARALSVMNVLISYGIAAEKMRAIGFGDQYPLTDSTDQQDQMLNERIEIKWK